MNDAPEFSKRYYQRPLRLTFPININEFSDPAVTTSAIIRIAQQLVDDTEAHSILQRVGLHEQMTWQELCLIDEKVINFATDLSRKTTGWDNVIVAIALARQYIVGEIGRDDSNAALRYAQGRLCFDSRAVPEGPTMRLSEAYQIYKNMLKRPELIEPYEEIRKRKLKPEDEIFENEEEKERIINPIINFFGQQLDIYASRNRKEARIPDFFTILGRYAMHEIDSLEPELIIEELRKWGGHGITSMIDDLEEIEQ